MRRGNTSEREVLRNRFDINLTLIAGGRPAGACCIKYNISSPVHTVMMSILYPIQHISTEAGHFGLEHTFMCTLYNVALNATPFSSKILYFVQH